MIRAGGQTAETRRWGRGPARQSTELCALDSGTFLNTFTVSSTTDHEELAIFFGESLDFESVATKTTKNNTDTKRPQPEKCLQTSESGLLFRAGVGCTKI